MAATDQHAAETGTRDLAAFWTLTLPELTEALQCGGDGLEFDGCPGKAFQLWKQH